MIKNYGYRCVTLELRNQGFIINHKKVKCFMKELGLVARILRKCKYSSYKGKVDKNA
ncbi:IS3 family transposase [Lactococcus lactis]|uniref:IS3 family transposase n=1 Tax=Lactococcus lactis TaxID=1358 RepID=UPI0037BEBB64